MLKLLRGVVVALAELAAPPIWGGCPPSVVGGARLPCLADQNVIPLVTEDRNSHHPWECSKIIHLMHQVLRAHAYSNAGLELECSRAHNNRRAIAPSYSSTIAPHLARLG